MLGGLPDRPISEGELQSLMESEAIRLVVPATSESIQRTDDGTRTIHDLVVFTADAVATVAYVENEDGWQLIASERGDDSYESAFDALVDYRGYTVEEEAGVRNMTQMMAEIMTPDLSELDVDIDAFDRED